ncbi:hypothetical protein A5784_30755 [Mycobacterium sp. 852013-50091_SCH5140682]|nr:hypothetical protein A5784_30755 [Mycobacterium sp. 852013-50091_SCH5140682]
MVQIAPHAWVATLPMSCPRCGLAWSHNGLTPIRGQVHRGRGHPPDAQVATTSYQCAECGHTSYDEH